VEDSQDLSPTSSSHRVSITAIIIYVLLALPASISVSGIITYLLEMSISSTEIKQYGMISILILIASLVFLFSLVILLVVVKKAPNILPAIIWVFAGLTLLLGFFN
jgi:hypothetical protein